MRTTTRPRRISLSAKPDEVAAALRHLPGFIWLDTSGRVPEADREQALSIIAAIPQAILSGHICQPGPLQHALAAFPPEADLGFPSAGLFGWVEYDGGYRFACCRNVLVYRHATEEWFESGDLLCHADFQTTRARWPGVEFHPELERSEFLHMVRRAQEYIASGDIYQVNLAQSWSAEWDRGVDPFAFHLRLRELSPAPYAAYLSLASRCLISSSPESFLRMSGQGIRTRPIKGTRPRHPDPDTDERIRQELVTSSKERAELVMITDLLRNDLGMVCEYGSVKVTGLLEPERYEQVHHMVSTVTGTMREKIDHVQALAACFPGGSITGAPKKRAMQVIHELERVPRGLYTGAVGYFGAGGESQFNIAIRTVALHNKAWFHAGAGIVADSVPEQEWEETLQKAAGVLAAAAPDLRQGSSRK